VSPLEISAYGRSYRINDPGGIIGKALQTGEPYEAKVLNRIYREKLSGTAIDVGASVGNHTLWFAAVCGLNVIAVEPLDHLRLRENVALNPELDIEVWPVGLGERPHVTEVTGPPAHVVGESFPTDGRVHVARLDDFKIPDVCLLKIDVEGQEPEVLKGAEQTIRECRPLIFAEAQDRQAATSNGRILRRWGYQHVRDYGATPLQEWRP
jgi:FkbM family methyltransferase